MRARQAGKLGLGEKSASWDRSGTFQSNSWEARGRKEEPVMSWGAGGGS